MYLYSLEFFLKLKKESIESYDDHTAWRIRLTLC